MKKKHLCRLAVLFVCVVFLIWLVKTGAEEAGIARQAEILELRSQAQTMLNSEWMVAQIVGPIQTHTYMFSIVELLPTGRVSNFQVSTKDQAWKKYQWRAGRRFRFKFEERPEVTEHTLTLAGFLAPTDVR